MSQQARNTSPVVPMVSGADLSAAQGHILKVGAAANTVVVAAAGTTPQIGVLDFPGKASGDQVGVQTSGIAMVKAGDAVTLGSPVMATTGGKGIDATTGKYYVGIALSAAAAADVLFPVLIQPGLVP